jgi:N,N'-diacetyllegionaminate synthase
VIAEAGVNHNGDVRLAHRLIDVAAEAGVDAIKFQTFEPEKLAAPEARKAEYQVENTGEQGNQLEMLRKLMLPKTAYAELLKHAADKQLLMLSTPFEEDSADFLEQFDMSAFKISSGDLTNHPFLAYVAKKDRPMLLSTGMASMEQVEAAVKIIREAGDPPLALFHCVTNYPADAADCNLRAIKTLQDRFGIPVGWSDHTLGIDICVAAVGLGADVVEKHFTLDRAMSGPDHVASLNPSELSEMMKSIRRLESAFGDGVKAPKPCEIAIASAARKSLHWKNNAAIGSKVTDGYFTALRPGTGISPDQITTYRGRVLARAVKQGQMVSDEDFAKRSEP